MQKLTPFLWYDSQAEEAAKFYTSLFKNSKIVNVQHGGPGVVMGVTVQLDGREYILFNGGPHNKLSEAVSLFVNCETQAEIDDLWSKFIDGGGTEDRCGWLKDKYGLSWQIVPPILGKLLGDPDAAKAKRVMDAMLGMVKLDIAGLQRAYDGP